MLLLQRRSWPSRPGVGISPRRGRALPRLQQMGLIEARHGSGNVARDPEDRTNPAVVEGVGPQTRSGVSSIEVAGDPRGAGPAYRTPGGDRALNDPDDPLRAAGRAVRGGAAGVGVGRRGATPPTWLTSGRSIDSTDNWVMGLLSAGSHTPSAAASTQPTVAYDEAQPVLADLRGYHRGCAGGRRGGGGRDCRGGSPGQRAANGRGLHRDAPHRRPALGPSGEGNDQFSVGFLGFAGAPVNREGHRVEGMTAGVCGLIDHQRDEQGTSNTAEVHSVPHPGHPVHGVCLASLRRWRPGVGSGRRLSRTTPCR